MTWVVLKGSFDQKQYLSVLLQQEGTKSRKEWDEKPCLSVYILTIMKTVFFVSSEENNKYCFNG